VKYAVVTIEFFKEYWGEIWASAKLTAQLWGQIVALAPKLAEQELGK
jgi:hypothetical protein